MAVYTYQKLNLYLQALKAEQTAPVYLIHGDELLYKTALEALLDKIISDSPGASRQFNYEPIDGTDENIPEAIKRVNTFSLLAGKKVVALCDSKIFYTKETRAALLKKAKEAYDKDDMHQASRHFLSYLAFSDRDLDDIGRANSEKKVAGDIQALTDESWVAEIVGFCKDQGLTVPSDGDTGRLLEESIGKGFPKGNHLVITTDLIDKRRRLYYVIDKNGVVIDCSVPKGDRRADKKAQEAVLLEEMRKILSKNKKEMDRSVYLALVEITGFDLRTFSNNLEKLVSYVGSRKRITVEDIESSLHRTKRDPLYELTGSILDKNIGRTLFFLNSLLSAGFHPLQILVALANVIRKMIRLKEFAESDPGRIWHAECEYNHFIRRVLPVIEENDAALINELETWQSGETSGEEGSGDDKRRTDSPVTDLLIAKNIKSPYPVYRMLQQTENFTRKGLIYALESLKEADLGLKSTGQDPKLILENALFKIWGQC